MQKVEVVPFDPSWAAAYEKERESLEVIFQDLPRVFYHIGSTSIPGCSAKPIIDILGVVCEISALDRLNAEMEEAGYLVRGEWGMRRRRFFQKEGELGVHLHVFEDSDPEVGRHLRFRDFLRAHPEVVQEYVALKESLAQQFSNDRVQYILGKEAWIKGIDCKAAWSADVGSEPALLGPRKGVWTQDEVVKAMEDNVLLEMTYFAKYLPTKEIVFQPDVTVVQSEVPSDTFNCVLCARFDAQGAKRRAQEIIDLYRARNLPFTWWHCPLDTPENLGGVLEEVGLNRVEDAVGMALDLDEFASMPQGDLKVERVLTLGQLEAFDGVHVRSGDDLPTFEAFFKQLPPLTYREGAPFEMYLGSVDGEAVTTGLLVFHAHVAGIYYLTTVPTCRRRGYGGAMMDHMLRRAQEKGYHMATLQASPDGLRLYERLGFKSVCLFAEYK